MNMRIKGTGSALPEKIVTNDELSLYVDTSDAWIRERTGIESRHISTGETVAELAAAACEKALKQAGKSAGEVELILVATCSPEKSLPGVACMVQALVGAERAVAFDLNAACSGFLFALNTAYSFMACGQYKNALVVGAEVLSKLMDWQDRSTCILFGDGAGAVYVEAEEGAGNYCFVQHSAGAKGGVLSCESRAIANPWHCEELRTPFVSMDGREIFRFAVTQIPMCIQEVLTKAGRQTEEIQLFFLHQANLRILTSIAKKLKVDMEHMPSNVAQVGNMSSASIPVLLDAWNEQGRLRKGMQIVMSGFGAGLTYGACVIEW